MGQGWRNSLPLIALLAGLAIPTVSVAQVTGAIGQPTQRLERPEEVRPAAARQAENYKPKGVALGAWRLYAEGAVDEVYNDNIYATPTGTVGAFVQRIDPAVELRSNWNNHALNFFAKGRVGLYSVDPGLNNYQDISVGGDGRLDIFRNWNVYGGASWNRRHEENGSPNTVTGVGLPITVYNQTSLNIGYFQKVNRISARLDGRFDNFTYQNNGLGLAQGIIPNNDRDRNEWREGLRFGYELTPGYEIWVRGGLNQRSYFQLDPFGVNRSSTGFDIVGGVLIDLGSITSIEVFAGYMVQNYVSSLYGSIGFPTFGMKGYWNPVNQLWLKPFVQRTIEDSAFTTSAAFINTTFGVDVTYTLRPNLQVDGRADYIIADYIPAAGTQGAPYEQYIGVRFGATYSPTERFFIVPSYQYLHRASNQVNGDFNRSIVMLRLGARL